LDFCEHFSDALWEQAYYEELDTYEDLDISVSACFLEVATVKVCGVSVGLAFDLPILTLCRNLDI
jgi:hypothetical protein